MWGYIKGVPFSFFRHAFYMFGLRFTGSCGSRTGSDTEVDVSRGVMHGDKLRGHLEELVVAAYKEVETFGVYVEYPSERGAER